MKGTPDLEKTAFFVKQIQLVITKNLGVTPNKNQIAGGIECTDLGIGFTPEAPPWLKRATLQVLGMPYPRLTDEEGKDSPHLKMPAI